MRTLQVCFRVYEFIGVCNRFSRYLDHYFRLFRSLFEFISIDYEKLELNYFVFEKHVIARTSKTNIRTLRLCVRFKYASFYRRFQWFQSLFESLFSTRFDRCLNLFHNHACNYKTLELNYIFICCCPFWHLHVSRLQGPFDYQTQYSRQFMQI